MELVKFKEVNLEDPFFDSLKADYKGFEEWFGRKSDNDAYIQKKNDSSLQAFLYLKIEDEAITDVIPNFPEAKRLKVGIGEPAKGEAVDFVLGKPKGDEKERFQKAIETSVEILIDYLKDGFEAAMNKFNQKGKEN